MANKRVKVKMRVPDGTVIEVEGDEVSVAKTVIEIGRRLRSEDRKHGHKRTASDTGKSQVIQQVRPADALKELVEEGFFQEGRTIDKVGKALDLKGVDTSGRKLSGIALVLNQWVREGRHGIRKEALTEKEMLEGSKGSWRYYASGANPEGKNF